MSVRFLKDDRFHSVSFFNTDTGFYYRSAVLDKQGRQTGEEPFMASFPHLIDVGIMGHCLHGKTGGCSRAGVQCYQDGPSKEQSNMSLDDFRRIVLECKGRTFQFALGGRGDPDQHESFKEILELCITNGIVPNYTTSGFAMTEGLAATSAKHCGAVAVSWYRQDYSLRAVNLLLREGIKTNIHYVLGNNSIEEALYLLQYDKLPKRINALIFLLHKPVGLGRHDNVLNVNDPRVGEFFKLVNARKYVWNIGFDSCSVPGLLNFNRTIDYRFVDTCEGGRFSCYISPDMQMMPCSFDQEKRFAVPIRSLSIQAGWDSEGFNRFRKKLIEACPSCSERDLCFGGCPLDGSIVLCCREERN
jgi:radical SAM protein with 4Fe4S-binding SPASM domain